MNPKPVAPPALVRYIELVSLHYSEMGLDPPVANAWSLRAMTREERSELATLLEFLLTQPPAKPKSNRIYLDGLGRLALFRDGLPELLETLRTMEEIDRAAKKAEPAAKRRHSKSR